MDGLYETLQLLLTLVPPQDIILDLTGIRWVSGGWWLECTVSCRGADPESTEDIHRVVGISLRITAVGPPRDG